MAIRFFKLILVVYSFQVQSAAICEKQEVVEQVNTNYLYYGQPRRLRVGIEKNRVH